MNYNITITPDKLCLIDEEGVDVVTFHVLPSPQICQIRKSYMSDEKVKDFLSKFIPHNGIKYYIY